ncbi:hypothetical protein ACQ4PT_020640 [Festuca glaucescens]
MSLPDDDLVVLEIFPRVKDVVALFRCAAVCKRWRDLLVSKPSLLRRCFPAAEGVCRSSSPFAGFFTQQRRRKGLPAPCFVPGTRPVLGPRGPLSSFVPGMGNLAVPLTSRHGLLLVRVGGLLIACDPLAGTFKPLPSLEHNWGRPGCFTGYAMLTAADCPSSERNDQQFPFFKVMIIVVTQQPMHYDLHTYSSGSAGELGWEVCSWNAAEAGHAIQVTLFQHNAAISCHGDAYWFFRSTSGSYIIRTSSTKTGQVIIAKVVNSTRLCSLLGDPTYDEPFLSIDADGRLAFLFLRIDGTRLDIFCFR